MPLSSPARPALAPVRAAAQDVLDPAHLRAALRVSPADATLAAALRCGAAVALAIAVPGLLGRPGLAAFASLGALTSLYGRYDPYRRRATLLATVGALMTGTIAAFTLLAAAGTPALVTTAAVALLAAGATAFCLLVRTGPPGATIVVFAAGAGLAGAPTLADVAPRALAAAARGAVARARDVLADDASWWRTRPAVPALAAELDAVEEALDATGVPRGDAGPAVRTTLRAQARSRAGGPWRLPTVRVGVAGLVAGAVAAVAGLGHAAWATMGSTAVLQGESARHAVVRALQRGAGTVAGALLAWPLLAAPLGFWGTAAVVVVLQTVTETIVGRHYGLAMLTITPMALLMTSLAHPADPSALALDRALDTVLGAVVGVLAVVLVHPRTRRRASETPGPPR
ncbi:FUSC family protein [Cellulosimicrobium cellulans]|uniref:FUSC family protein n=1 Tax=Cellulosimicrobium cellulans TaxID=1710 RepID=UPI003C4DCB52